MDKNYRNAIDWIVFIVCIIFAAQIFLLLMSIGWNRSKTCYGVVNLIWFSNIFVVIGFGLLAFSQTTISSFNEFFCDHFKDVNKTDNYLINKIGLENDQLRNITQTCVFGSQDNMSLSKYLKFDDYSTNLKNLNTDVKQFNDMNENPDYRTSRITSYSEDVLKEAIYYPSTLKLV
mgnify:CR=1 FL=1